MVTYNLTETQAVALSSLICRAGVLPSRVLDRMLQQDINRFHRGRTNNVQYTVPDVLEDVVRPLVERVRQDYPYEPPEKQQASTRRYVTGVQRSGIPMGTPTDRQ